jgi:hypothetical protein
MMVVQEVHVHFVLFLSVLATNANAIEWLDVLNEYRTKESTRTIYGDECVLALAKNKGNISYA